MKQIAGMTHKISSTEVTDRASFIKFINSLQNEFKADPKAWENHTLDSFLQALEAYTTDLQGYYDNIHPDINADIPSWRIFADILKGATIYE